MSYLIVKEKILIEGLDAEELESYSFEIFEKEEYNKVAQIVDDAIEEWFLTNEICSNYMGGDIFIEYNSPAHFWSNITVEEITKEEYHTILKLIGKNHGFNYNFLHNWVINSI